MSLRGSYHMSYLEETDCAQSPLAKAYGHGARYLRALQELGPRIDDYRGHPTHEVYEKTLRLAHGRKTSFWARFLES